LDYLESLVITPSLTTKKLNIWDIAHLAIWANRGFLLPFNFCRKAKEGFSPIFGFNTFLSHFFSHLWNQGYLLLPFGTTGTTFLGQGFPTLKIFFGGNWLKRAWSYLKNLGSPSFQTWVFSTFLVLQNIWVGHLFPQLLLMLGSPI